MGDANSDENGGTNVVVRPGAVVVDPVPSVQGQKGKRHVPQGGPDDYLSDVEDEGTSDYRKRLRGDGAGNMIRFLRALPDLKKKESVVIPNDERRSKCFKLLEDVLNTDEGTRAHEEARQKYDKELQEARQASPGPMVTITRSTPDGDTLNVHEATAVSIKLTKDEKALRNIDILKVDMGNCRCPFKRVGDSWEFDWERTTLSARRSILAYFDCLTKFEIDGQDKLEAYKAAVKASIERGQKQEHEQGPVTPEKLDGGHTGRLRRRGSRDSDSDAAVPD